MTGQLRSVGDGEDGQGPARCAICGDLAVGPCARCKRPVCGDCCKLTEGGVRTWAVCTRCARSGGASLGAGWRTVLVWVLVPPLGLAAIALLVAWLRRP